MTSSGNDEKWTEKLRDHFDGKEETKRQLRENSLQEGRYLLEKRIGEGAFAVVYRALDRKLSRPVAVKVLREQAAANDVIRKRFLREARSIGKISHPNVVSVHDVGEEGPQMYLVMELLEGQTLQHLFERERGEIRSRVKLLEQVSRGLAVAHAQGVIHRDVKPANILLTAEGIPKIADFGLAHLRDSRTLLTDSGATMGTPAYMSPEQVRGRIGEIGPRTDVYALGMVLYEILTGVLAHKGNTPVELYNRIVEEDPVRPRIKNPSAPEDLETICLKALSKESARRYANATEFADDLRRWIDGEPIEARPASWMYLVRRKVYKRKGVWMSLGGAAVLLAGVLGFLLPRLFEAREANENFDLSRPIYNEAQRMGSQLIALEKKPGADPAEIQALFERSSGKYREVLALIPSDLQSLMGMGIIFQAMDRLEEAFTWYDKATRWHPAYPPAYEGRGIIRDLLGDLEGAMLDFNRAIELDPEFASAYNNRGHVFYQEKAFDKAIADYTRSISLSPGDAKVYSNRGVALQEIKDFKRAYTDFAKSVELDPLSPFGYQGRGYAKHLQGDLEGAIVDYTKAIELDPNFAKPRTNRGAARWKLGDVKGAISDLTRALKLDPGSLSA